MSATRVEDIANAVMYEGYILYPYRPSAVKNRQRWNFGVLYPRAFSEAQTGDDPWMMQTECLAEGDASASLTVTIRFLQLMERTTPDQTAPPWQEAVERSIVIASLNLAETLSRPVGYTRSFPASCEDDGRFIRKQEAIECAVEASVEQPAGGLFAVRISVFNTTPLDDGNIATRDRALLRSLASAHTILELQNGAFVSLLEPPEPLTHIAARCRNSGTWPVLVGEPGQRETMLSSPIILYDYPQIAPESAGALFDGAEIDEILTLRILTLTDEEKKEMAEGDDRARLILERTESMPPEQLMKMHGVLRGMR